MNKFKITETCLRDGHQSLIATRLTTDEILPILGEMDKVGYNALEVWGGATFDSCIRYLNEDPWERLREIRKIIKNTKLQMLLRGQNILGYRHYADDVVEKFIFKSIENGIDIIRVFDALNDLRNLKTSIDSVKKYGSHLQIAMSYSISPVHTNEYYIKLSKDIENMGADSICIKDMSGILLPYEGYELIREIKKNISIPLEIHTHSTCGLGEMLYLKAVEAGADIIDTAISTFGGGTSQPPTESIVKSFENTKYSTGIDFERLEVIADYFKPIREKYLNQGILSSKSYYINPQIIETQLPGGMISNMVNQMKAQGAENRFDEVLKEIPRVRKDLGYPPLVTPLSQMVGTQAVMNILSKEKYKMVSKEIKDYIKGLYGKPPADIDSDLKKKILGDEEEITCRPADLIENEFLKFKEESASFAKNDEDVLSYILFPQIAKNFLEKKYNQNDKQVININLEFN